MVKITLGIDGMACPMCESHVNEAIRKALPVKKVSASHRKGCAEIIAEAEIPQEAIARALEGTGYRVLSCQSEPYEKKGFLKGLFSRSE